jgi:hypothetical protein
LVFWVSARCFARLCLACREGPQWAAGVPALDQDRPYWLTNRGADWSACCALAQEGLYLAFVAVLGAGQRL